MPQVKVAYRPYRGGLAEAMLEKMEFGSIDHMLRYLGAKDVLYYGHNSNTNSSEFLVVDAGDGPMGFAWFVAEITYEERLEIIEKSKEGSSGIVGQP